MSLPLYLASRSPRRKELLAQAGIRFQVHVPQEEELAAPKLRKKGAAKPRQKLSSARAIVKQISSAKAHAAVKELRAMGVHSALVLSADTLVFLKNRVLGKPANIAEAQKTLRALSGKTHEVLTGVTVLALQNGKLKEHAIQIRTDVEFLNLKPQWINWYIETGEPFDKAGAYGCQGYGAALIRSFRGSYTTVMGLPLEETLELLEKAGKTTRQSLQQGPA